MSQTDDSERLLPNQPEQPNSYSETLGWSICSTIFGIGFFTLCFPYVLYYIGFGKKGVRSGSIAACLFSTTPYVLLRNHGRPGKLVVPGQGLEVGLMKMGWFGNTVLSIAGAYFGYMIAPFLLLIAMTCVTIVLCATVKTLADLGGCTWIILFPITFSIFLATVVRSLYFLNIIVILFCLISIAICEYSLSMSAIFPD